MGGGGGAQGCLTYIVRDLVGSRGVRVGLRRPPGRFLQSPGPELIGWTKWWKWGAARWIWGCICREPDGSVRTGMQRGSKDSSRVTAHSGWSSRGEASAPLHTPPLPRCDVSLTTPGRSGGARVAGLRWPVRGVRVCVGSVNTPVGTPGSGSPPSSSDVSGCTSIAVSLTWDRGCVDGTSGQLQSPYSL